jgi:hypothetical protein
MDWDELWASDSDGEITEDVAPKEGAVLSVDIPALPLRLLLTHGTTAAAVAANASAAAAAASADAAASAAAAAAAASDAAASGTGSDDEREERKSAEVKDYGLKTSLSARRAELFHRSFPFSRDVVYDAQRVPDSLKYAPVFGDSEAKTIETHLPKCMLPSLSPSDHLLLMGLSSITHSLYGGSVASSLDASGVS